MSEDPLVPQIPASASIQTDSPSSGEGAPRPHRRRRRRRRRGGGGGRPPGNNGGGGGQPGIAYEPRIDEAAAAGPERPVEGVLYLPPKESAPGILVSARTNYLPSPKDPIVPRDLINREGLEPGALITGFAVDGNRTVVRRVEQVEGLDPAAFRQRPAFGELVSIDPHDHLKLETEPDEMCGRVTDLLAPIGRGQLLSLRPVFRSIISA